MVVLLLEGVVADAASVVLLEVLWVFGAAAASVVVAAVLWQLLYLNSTM